MAVTFTGPVGFVCILALSVIFCGSCFSPRTMLAYLAIGKDSDLMRSLQARSGDRMDSITNNKEEIDLKTRKLFKYPAIAAGALPSQA